MKKVLTVIVPSYNMEKYLERCLSSLIVSQEKMSWFEVLVINDGSKDRTSEIGHSFETRFPETFRVIDKNNGHYGSCVNRGLVEAQGTFVKILDADDSFDTIVFDEYLGFLQERIDDADFVLSEYIQVDDNQVLLNKHIYDDYPEPFSLGDLSDIDRLRWFIHGLAYRTSLLRDNGYRQTEGIAYTDMEWCFFPAAYVRRGYRFHGFLYKYTKLREEQSVNPTVQGRNIGMQIQVVENIVRRFPETLAGSIVESRSFLKELALLNVSQIYQLVLLTLHRHITSDAPLFSFDHMLKEENLSLYELAGEYRTAIGPFRFMPVKLWRNGHRFRLKVVQAIYTLADFKSKLTGRKN